MDEDCGSLDLQGAVVTSSTGEELLLELLLRKSFFGAIYQARPRQSDKLFAVKVIRLDERAEDTLIAEDKFGDMRFRHLLHGHPHVLTPLDVFRTEAFLFIVTPLAEYQDLQACLDVALPEPEARYIFKQVCEAVGFVHRQRVAWRDLSLENVLVFAAPADTSTDGVHVKAVLCDPGQAVQGDDKRQGLCGKSFRPPEVYDPRPYDPFLVDAFCLGWMLYRLLTGTALFQRATAEDRQWLAHLRGDWPPEAEVLSDDVKQLLRALLQPDPERRLGVPEALAHSWFQGETAALGRAHLSTAFGGRKPPVGSGILAENRQHLEHVQEASNQLLDRLHRIGLGNNSNAAVPDGGDGIEDALAQVSKLLALKANGWALAMPDACAKAEVTISPSTPPLTS